MACAVCAVSSQQSSHLESAAQFESRVADPRASRNQRTRAHLFRPFRTSFPFRVSSADRVPVCFRVSAVFALAPRSTFARFRRSCAYRNRPTTTPRRSAIAQLGAIACAATAVSARPTLDVRPAAFQPRPYFRFAAVRLVDEFATAASVPWPPSPISHGGERRIVPVAAGRRMV